MIEAIGERMLTSFRSFAWPCIWPFKVDWDESSCNRDWPKWLAKGWQRKSNKKKTSWNQHAMLWNKKFTYEHSQFVCLYHKVHLKGPPLTVNSYVHRACWHLYPLYRFVLSRVGSSFFFYQAWDKKTITYFTLFMERLQRLESWYLKTIQTKYIPLVCKY